MSLGFIQSFKMKKLIMVWVFLIVSFILFSGYKLFINVDPAHNLIRCFNISYYSALLYVVLNIEEFYKDKLLILYTGILTILLNFSWIFKLI